MPNISISEMNSRLVNSKFVREYLGGISDRQLMRYVRGESILFPLKMLRIGKSRRFRFSDLEKFIRDNANNPKQRGDENAGN